MFSLFKKKPKQENIPEYWKKYLSLFEIKPDYNIPISAAEFVILDVESNGLDPKKDKILSIGAVKISANQIDVSNSLELFLKQSEFNPEAAPIHGIMKNGNFEKVSEQRAMKMLVEYFDVNVIVGYNINFDISIINETLKHHSCDRLLNRSLDIVNLYKRLKGADFRAGSPLSLDLLSDEFNIPQSDRHNAAGDALITAILFMKISARLKKRGVETLKELLRIKRIFI